MNLRRLELKDAERMLEWMHNNNITEHMRTDFSQKTLSDCEHFIEASLSNNTELHMASVDEHDIYMGTVSLKNINIIKKTAEFAITMHVDALGKEYSHHGMQKIIAIGFEQLNLSEIYWCVSQKNIRAIKFYDKHFYSRCYDIPEHIEKAYDQTQQNELIWYFVKKSCKS